MNRRTRLAGLSTVAGTLLGALAGLFVIRAVARDWDGVRASLAGASPLWVVVAWLLAVCGMTSIGLPWRRALRILGGRLGWSDTLARYYLGELGKYVPGGLWPVVGRGELAVRAGVPRLAAYGSVALSLAGLYLASMLVALAAVPAMFEGGEGAGAVLVLVLLPLGFLGLHHAVLERARRIGCVVLRRDIDLPIPRWGESLTLLASYLPAWLLIGGATWAVVRALGQDASLWQIVPATAISWTVGFVLVPVPGGLGVREVTFVAASGLAPGVGAAVAIVARVMFVLVDALGALVASMWLGRRSLTAAHARQEPDQGGEGIGCNVVPPEERSTS